MRRILHPLPFTSHFLTSQPNLPCFLFFFELIMGSHRRPHPDELKIALTLILIISLTFFPHNSVAAEERKGVKKQNSKLGLGSRPPGCFNKCQSCKPCKAALVISPHHRENHNGDKSALAQRDEGYYLLSWKCKCGNKFFQP